jgi:hypothetical protein
LGLEKERGKRHGCGGAYKGLSLTDIEENMRKGLASSTDSKEAKNDGAEKAMLTWKRKEREWMEGVEEGLVGTQRKNKKKEVTGSTCE